MAARREAISKKRCWFKSKTGPHFNPQAFLSISKPWSKVQHSVSRQSAKSKDRELGQMFFLRWRLLTLLILLPLIAIPASAEFYKYKDANGVLRFTDNLLEVPEDQRENLQSYQEVVTPEESPATPDTVKKEAALQDRNNRIEQMNAEREILAQSYSDLESERKALLESAPDPQDQKAYEAHRKSIEAFNEKIKTYEEKRKLFQDKVDAFNAEISP